MKVAIGCDPNAEKFKKVLIPFVESLGHECVDFGSNDPIYANTAIALAENVASKECDRGILICGTGIGMAITANKVPGVRAACCHDPYSAERARKSNDAQVITMGAQIVAPTLARLLIDHWLASEFAGGRSATKVDKIKKLDERYHPR